MRFLTFSQGLGDLHEFINDRYKVHDFENQLDVISAIFKPISSALTLLEMRETSPADVFYVWISAAAQLKSLFTNLDRQHHEGLPLERIPFNLKKSIIEIFNKRYCEMLDNAPTDVYLLAFFLHPCMFQFFLTKFH